MQFLIFQKKKPHRNKKAAKNDCLFNICVKLFLNIKPEVHDIAILHNIFLAFDSYFTYFTTGSFRS